jgi:hypothetical protein
MRLLLPRHLTLCLIYLLLVGGYSNPADKRSESLSSTRLRQNHFNNNPVVRSLEDEISTVAAHDNGKEDNPEFYDPTEEELKRGVAYAPPVYWGVLLRKTKSLRIAFTGGSQTVYAWSYVSIFTNLNERSSQRDELDLCIL